MFSIVVFALIWGGLVISVDALRAGHIWTELIFLWVLIGLVAGLFVLAFVHNGRKALSAIRFGEIPLILISSPVCFGGTLEGILVFPNDKAPKSIVAKLDCRVRSYGDVTAAEQECRQLSKSEILEFVEKRAPNDVRELARILNTGAAHIPISLEVPTRVPDLDFPDDFENESEWRTFNEEVLVNWKVRVSAELSGIDFIRSYYVAIWRKFKAQTGKPSAA